MIHIVPSITNKSAGPSYSVVRLCENLINRGLNLKLATLDDGKSNLPQFVKTFSNELFYKKLGYSKTLYNWIDYQIKQDPKMIIHNHSLWMMPNIYPGMVSKKYNNPVVISPRGTLSKWSFKNGSFMKRLMWFFLQKKNIENCFCFHATSELECKEIKLLGFRNPVAVIPNGIDIYKGKSKSLIIKKKKRLLFLGRIHKKKGLDILFNIWNKIKMTQNDWELKIVGPDDGYLKDLKLIKKKLSLSDVIFSEKKEGDEKWDEFLNADLFILPSHSENFGMAIAEALSVGLPVITTKNTPWKDLKNYNAGWCAEVNEKSLYENIINAMQLDQKQLFKIGDNGKKWMEREFNWEIVATKMLSTYRWIENKEKKPDFIF